MSPNSRAAMRFAIQLAEQIQAQLIFLHIHQIPRVSFWSDQQYQQYIGRDREKIMKPLAAFIKSLYRSMAVPAPEQLPLAVHHDLDVTEGIVQFAQSQKASYICISTRGSGVVRKLFGSTSSSLITASPVPVFCIPSSWRQKPVKSILYASDISRYESELKQVVALARPLEASVEMLHLAFANEFFMDSGRFEQNLKELAGYPVRFRLQPRDVSRSVMQEVESVVRKTKPSLLVLFTHQNRSFFKRLFLPGNAKQFSALPLIPFLSIPRQEPGRA